MAIVEKKAGGGPLVDLVPPGKHKGDPLPPESMVLREKLIAEHQEKMRKKRAENPPKPEPPQEPPLIPKDIFDVMHRVDFDRDSIMWGALQRSGGSSDSEPGENPECSDDGSVQSSCDESSVG